jgi:prephenate dehydratase
MKKVAIQGGLGSYHDIAAHNYFKVSPDYTGEEELSLICCSTFEEVFDAVAHDSSVMGLVAIENTIAGSLLHNYELLRQSDTRIVGEYKLRISHCLVCLPEDDWDDIREVNSHPIALMQCQEFLAEHPNYKVVEKEDTALSAETISRLKLRGHAAICSLAAAERYGMKVLQTGIETNKHNFTRFLVVADSWQVDELRRTAHEPENKASIVFSLPHTSGSLSQALSILSFYGINLTKIQSLPIIGREWEYQFYVDVVFTDMLRYKQSIAAITPLTKELKILGEYTDGPSNV